MASLTYITDDFDYYAKVYQTYVNLSEKEGSIEEWVHSSFGDTVVSRLSAAYKNKDTLKVLGVGSGAGHNDCAMLETLLPSFPKICNTVVEPAVAQIDLFKQRVEEHREALKGVSFEWVAQTSDDYLQSMEKNATESKKFHLITAVHLLYYVTDLKDTIRRLHNLLEDGGILFIIIGSREITSLSVLRRINSLHEKMVPLHPSDEDVLSALDSLGLKYSPGLVHRYVKGGALFDEQSEQGQHLLDFYTHVKDFRGTAPASLRENVLQFLREPDLALKRGDEVYFHRHWVHITIPK